MVLQDWSNLCPVQASAESISPVIFSKRETNSVHARLKISSGDNAPSDSKEKMYSPSISSSTIALSKSASLPVPGPTWCSALSKSSTAFTSVHSLFLNNFESIALPELEVRFRLNRVFAFLGLSSTAFCLGWKVTAAAGHHFAWSLPLPSVA